MDGNRDEQISLRFGRREGGRLALALFLSLCIHLGIWCGYEANKKYSWWNRLMDLRPEPKISQRQTVPATPTALSAPMNTSEPMILVEVSHADFEPPAQAKYYSDKNSQAANPEAGDTRQPKLNGRQSQMPKAEDVAVLPKVQPSAPPPQPRPAPEEKTDESPIPAMAAAAAPPAGQGHPGQPGTDTTHPQTPDHSPTPPAHERPRTVQQALQQQLLPGRQMHEEGGVRRIRSVPSFDVKGTPFGDYDHAIVVAVTQRWYDLLDSHRFAQDRTGEVVLQFRLKPDGTVMNLRRSENTVGEMLGYVCQEAVEESAPFAKWPPEMMRTIGANYREITFSFYYN
jgi:hypothetical protein